MILLNTVYEVFKTALISRAYEMPDHNTNNEIADEITSKFDNLLDQVTISFEERKDDNYYIMNIGHKYSFEISNNELIKNLQ